MPTIEVFNDTRQVGTCRSCGAAIEWAVLRQSGRRMPFNAPIVPVRTYANRVDRLITVVDTTSTPSHFATCPQAAEWRKPR